MGSKHSIILHALPDKLYLQIMYLGKFGKIINFRKPKTFNEKLQWLKIYDRKPEYTKMVDKYAAKEYVANIIGQEHVIPTLGVWRHASEIDFENLPNQFVLKCNNDSGGIVICKDKNIVDKEKTLTFLSKQLNNNGFWYGREWPYKNVEPCIIAEPYLENKEFGELRDYKFFCFNGKVRCFKVDFGRFSDHHANYYDTEGTLLSLGEKSFPPEPEMVLNIPGSLQKMVLLAEKLAEGTRFLRVDFYDVSGHVYFGELTFYPASGFGKFTTDEWDRTMGEWLDLGK